MGVKNIRQLLANGMPSTHELIQRNTAYCLHYSDIDHRLLTEECLSCRRRLGELKHSHDILPTIVEYEALVCISILLTSRCRRLDETIRSLENGLHVPHCSRIIERRWSAEIPRKKMARYYILGGGYAREQMIGFHKSEPFGDVCDSHGNAQRPPLAFP
jgi:hypothetical protein